MKDNKTSAAVQEFVYRAERLRSDCEKAKDIFRWRRERAGESFKKNCKADNPYLGGWDGGIEEMSSDAAMRFGDIAGDIGWVLDSVGAIEKKFKNMEEALEKLNKHGALYYKNKQGKIVMFVNPATEALAFDPLSSDE